MNLVVSYIHRFLHFFHRPFSKLLTQQQFRYLASGGTLAMLDVLFFYVTFHYILGKAPVHLGNFEIESYRLAFWLPFPVTLMISFLSSKYIVFPGSHLPGGIQLFRYLLLVAACAILNYYLLVFFVDICSFYPTFGKLATTVIVAGFSYLVQRHFTFRGNREIRFVKKHFDAGNRF